MSDPLSTVQTIYRAFGAGDLPTLLQQLADDVQWRFHGDRAAPFTGLAVGKAQVTEWFVAIAGAEDIQAFEPREFLVGPGHVTVLGWERTIARPGGGTFECEWVHVWNVGADGRVQRFWGMYDSEASARARAGG